MSTLSTLDLQFDFVTNTEMIGVANRRGYRTHRTQEGAWLQQRSAIAPGALWLAGAGPHGPFVAATDHPGVAVEIQRPLIGTYPGKAAWEALDVEGLDALVDKIYRLSVSLPTHPLATYERQLAEQPYIATETIEMRKRRIGQDVFRKALLRYWNGTCPLTGITEPSLLRASHIRPWAECNDAERLDVHNGILLSALWDAAFDKGIVSFDDEGHILTRSNLQNPEINALGIMNAKKVMVNLKPQHILRIRDHRTRHKF